MHCARNRKVAGSFPVGVIGIFYLLNPFGCTMALRWTQPIREMSTRVISWEGGKGVQCVGLTEIPSSCTNCLEVLGDLTFWHRNFFNFF
jgi:hypothetical protein